MDPLDLSSIVTEDTVYSECYILQLNNLLSTVSK